MYFLRGSVWEAPSWAVHKTEEVSCLVSDKTSRSGFHVIIHQRPYTQSHQQTRWERFLAREWDFFPKAPTLALGVSQSIYWVHRGYAPGGKATGALSWPLTCNVDIKNWRYTSTSTQPYLNGVVHYQTQKVHGKRQIADWTTVFRKSLSCAYWAT